LNECRLAGERERDLETSGVQGTEVILTKLGRPVVANRINQKSRSLEISIVGSVDERYMKLAATFGNFAGNVGCDEQEAVRGEHGPGL
jgi:hypothetical protein